LVKAFADYRALAGRIYGWDLVLCGDGPQARRIDDLIAQSGHSSAIHRPGFVHADGLSRWYAYATAFVLPSISEPWGLVVNEAASAALPLLVSERAGCAPTFVPEPQGITGARLNPFDLEDITLKLAWLSRLSDEERQVMGERAAGIADQWGPRRFAEGFLEAIELAVRPRMTHSHLTVGRAS
jgi:glycosyltransferase involved in cell wall biosynthesis